MGAKSMIPTINTPNIRPSSFIIVASIVALIYMSIPNCNGTPLPNPDESLGGIKKAWDINELHTIKTEDGTTYQISTRDIILISVGGFVAFALLVCLIGYCFCECVKKLVCCICCCDC